VLVATMGWAGASASLAQGLDIVEEARLFGARSSIDRNRGMNVADLALEVRPRS
jgi:hypothetical protein